MTAPAPLVAGRWDWDGVCQDDGAGDWTAGNDHGRRCDRLNSQRRTPEDRNVIKTPGQPALLRTFRPIGQNTTVYVGPPAEFLC